MYKLTIVLSEGDNEESLGAIKELTFFTENGALITDPAAWGATEAMTRGRLMSAMNESQKEHNEIVKKREEMLNQLKK